MRCQGHFSGQHVHASFGEHLGQNLGKKIWINAIDKWKGDMEVIIRLASATLLSDIQSPHLCLWENRLNVLSAHAFLLVRHNAGRDKTILHLFAFFQKRGNALAGPKTQTKKQLLLTTQFPFHLLFFLLITPDPQTLFETFFYKC